MPLFRKVDLVWLRCPGCHGNQGPGVLHRHPGTQYVYWVRGLLFISYLLLIMN